MSTATSVPPMPMTGTLRLLFLASAVFTLTGVAIFGLPRATPGALAGLPADVPAVYRGLAAIFMLLFGGLYAWIATRPSVQTGLVAFAAIAKLVAFVGFVLMWLTAAVPLRTLGAVSGDLVLAVLMLAALTRWQGARRTGR